MVSQLEYMFLNEDFSKIQNCLYNILKTKKKLKIFKNLYECSEDKINEVEIKLNEIYSSLIDIMEAHSYCNCDNSSDDEVDPAN